MYDFFFRGFVMSTFWGRTRYWVIFIQTILFLILMVGTKSFTWGLVPYLINAPLAGLIVCKSKSLIYSTVFQLLVIIILDAGIVRLAR
jgi:membrane protease YdiL (CAAX protease family)